MQTNQEPIIINAEQKSWLFKEGYFPINFSSEDYYNPNFSMVPELYNMFPENFKKLQSPTLTADATT
jgi:hypothetical protein